MLTGSILMVDSTRYLIFIWFCCISLNRQEVDALKVLKHNVELDSSLRDSSSAEGSESDDNCVGQCAFQFVDQLKMELGDRSVLGLLDLNFNEFLIAFSNITFFEAFCKHYHNFEYCYSRCSYSFMHELLSKSAAIIDHFCVYNYKAIHERFGCLSKLDSDVSKQCLNICVPHHKAVNSIMNNFKYLALNGDSSSAEKYLNESCEYVICALHCDVPAIAHHCGHETSNLVIDLTRKSFNSMQSMALGTGAISRWPVACAEIQAYKIPQRPSTTPSQSEAIPTTESIPTGTEAIPVVSSARSSFVDAHSLMTCLFVILFCYHL